MGSPMWEIPCVMREQGCGTHRLPLPYKPAMKVQNLKHKVIYVITIKQTKKILKTFSYKSNKTSTGPI